METANFTSVPAQVRYMIDDQVDIVSTPSLSDSLPYVRNVVHQRRFKFRKINQRNVSRSVQPASAGNPVARPPSRYSAGETFYDTKINQLTVSDGSNWRDVSGALVGNLLHGPAGADRRSGRAGLGERERVVRHRRRQRVGPVQPAAGPGTHR